MPLPRRFPVLLGIVALAGALGACSDPNPPGADFVVAVGDEQFVLRSTDPDTIAQLRDVLAGKRTGFPAGPLRAGDGGFNSPWTWHFDEDKVVVAEVTIEICDGTPSYVETHLSSFPTYCPWSARIVSESER
jgi:hypothetical protein